jgi:predicted 3-demethylubiquinone-9 3-methyltransferase (glyoxalase superfamily)
VNATAKITTFLWFDGRAEEAARFSVSLFKGSKVTSSSPTMTTFKLAGQDPPVTG